MLTVAPIPTVVHFVGSMKPLSRGAASNTHAPPLILYAGAHAQTRPGPDTTSQTWCMPQSASWVATVHSHLLVVHGSSLASVCLMTSPQPPATEITRQRANHLILASLPAHAGERVHHGGRRDLPRTVS